VPVDGKIVFGKASMNEASVSGESLPIDKVVGDEVFSSTLNESGFIKIRATGIGKNSTVERIAELIKNASAHKSKQEKLADNFAEVFLPALLILGCVTYYFSQDIKMVASLFLVACADDMAVAIPLAMTASLGRAARRGVIIKGGQWLDALANMKTIVFDKTGTLTYGTLAVQGIHLEEGVSEEYFWKMVGSAEKYSEHPIGRAIFKEANKKISEITDPDTFERHESKGVFASFGGDTVAVGNENLFPEIGIVLDKKVRDILVRERLEHKITTALVYINKKFSGVITVADVVHPEAKRSVESLRNLGVENIQIFTGDNEEITKTVSSNLGINNFNAKMVPETKLLELEKMSKVGVVGMVGDGINDAPSLARADVGIAMGNGSSAVAVEAADVIILTNNLNRIPEMIRLGRKTQLIIRWNMFIWAISNIVGFALVFTGVIGPVLAAFYNFATDFFPLINSSRLFKEKI
ncbi:MAG TPA: heavy metal translocating P-type ATPase, partial [Candidatus Paceibacterota bacterium]|nr:heavy metal translocating P-type ATPase [Candidatus Paceibacterota bacterium]